MADDSLARDYGYDITMSDGNMGLPSAVHKEYMERCNMLYKEFVTNMSLHMKEVKVVKKELRSLHEQKMRHLRFSLYRSNKDPFARNVGVSSTPTAGLDSRNNTPWGLENIPDEDRAVRPVTAPGGTHTNGHAHTDIRPKTAGHEHRLELIVGDDDDDENVSEADLSQVSGVSKSTVIGVLDRRTEQSSSRKIIVGQQSFNKIQHGDVRAKLKHREGRFIVKPIRVDLESELITSDTVAFDPLKSKTEYDPLYERLALVRKLTDFKTPTISSDMKINNRVPIQKSLKGVDAKRTTISEIYQNARDRKTRHFRIVSNSNRSKSAVNSKEKVTTIMQKFIDSFGRKSAGPERTFGSRLSNTHDVSRGNTPNYGNVKDEIDSVASANNSILRPTMESSSNSMGLNDSFNGRDQQKLSTTSATTNETPRRPQSKVAFVRTDSQSSGNVFLQTGDSAKLSASFSSNSGITKQFGDKLSVSSAIHPGNEDRTRTISASSDASVFNRQASADDNPKRFERTPSVLSRTDSFSRGSDGTPRGRLGMSANEKQLRGLDASMRSDSGLSLTSTMSAAKKDQAKKHLERKFSYVIVDGVKQKLGFQAPTKIESRLDSVSIVKQQIKKDRQLDETMTVWRRRMAARSSALSSKSILFNRRGKLR
ncbi:hypothetical protein ACF0H5_002091 [Mactra antiquata]